MDVSQLPSDFFVHEDAFTRKTYRDVYPAIDPTRPELSQAGKVVVITGASLESVNWIRQGFAASFARAKAEAIVLIARDASKLAETKQLIKEINPATKVLSLAVDVVDEPGIKDAFRQIVERLGTPHVLINNAGVTGALKSIFDEDIDSWWRTREINIRGTMIVTKAFLATTGREPETPTTIIHLSSTSAGMTPPGMSSYSLTKVGWRLLSSQRL
ncbi:hypothetical protein ATEIFO6365_0016002100 [Aspergillus terreus]|uniref:Uncharacterized protein n=1 Tax=Aspergillus terreus TaxID=33178 RepID=A0A5M3ZER5_ASPTE|nr:hypothetical protein ATETN484_0017002100 [Aspergillus terreus]GFF21700.1 hypothetical protein ATEIFO6365_0016002100 [Aspergillus terreus]